MGFTSAAKSKDQNKNSELIAPFGKHSKSIIRIELLLLHFKYRALIFCNSDQSIAVYCFKTIFMHNVNLLLGLFKSQLILIQVKGH